MHAARLRTLPLSVSGIIVGTALANSLGFYNTLIFIGAILTTIMFQVTSNLANDYGDGMKGTDDDRIGPKRAFQSGMLSKKELRRGIFFSSVLGFVLAMGLIYIAFGKEHLNYIFFFSVLGMLSIWAAIKYTVGSSPYGYRGLGDIFVFLFFGQVSVLGTMFLYTKSITLLAFLPSVTIGLLCTGVLNLNNLRDVVSDQKHGKNTLVVKMGFANGKRYHYVLLMLSFFSMAMYTVLSKSNFYNAYYLLAFLPVFLHMHKVMVTNEPVLLDTELKKLALSTFLLALLFLMAVNNFL